jgi:predicted lipid-binding transport protein (Tim44 family)
MRIRPRASIITVMNKPTDRLSGPRGPVSASPPAGAMASQWIGRVLGIVVGTAIAIGALFVSVVAFSVVLVVGVVVGGWLWWRTREVRRRFREEVARMQQALDGAGSAPGSRSGMGGAEPRGTDPFGARAGRGRPAGSGDVLDGDFIREASDRARRGDDTDSDRPAG